MTLGLHVEQSLPELQSCQRLREVGVADPPADLEEILEWQMTTPGPQGTGLSQYPQDGPVPCSSDDHAYR